MARSFVRASQQYLEITSAAVTALPCTLACWFRSNDVTVDQMLINVIDPGPGSYHGYNLLAEGSQAGDPINARTRTGAGQAQCRTTTGFTANTWHHACGVFASATDRRAFLNGGGKGTNSLNRDPSGMNRTSIGRTSNNDDYMSGQVAEAAVWNAALDDVEVLALAKGASPLRVRPLSLVAYWPLWGFHSPEIDLWKGNLTLSVVGGPTLSDHAPVMPFSQAILLG